MGNFPKPTQNYEEYTDNNQDNIDSRTSSLNTTEETNNPENISVFQTRDSASSHRRLFTNTEEERAFHEVRQEEIDEGSRIFPHISTPVTTSTHTTDTDTISSNDGAAQNPELIILESRSYTEVDSDGLITPEENPNAIPVLPEAPLPEERDVPELGEITPSAPVIPSREIVAISNNPEVEAVTPQEQSITPESLERNRQENDVMFERLREAGRHLHTEDENRDQRRRIEEASRGIIPTRIDTTQQNQQTHIDRLLENNNINQPER